MSLKVCLPEEGVTGAELLQVLSLLKSVALEKVVIEGLPSFSSFWGSKFVDEVKQNFTLTEFPIQASSLANDNEEVARRLSSIFSTILQLNGCGRRYLVEDKFSKRRAVSLLAKVAHDLNCIYFHIRENPQVCKRCRRTKRRRQEKLCSGSLRRKSPGKAADRS